MIVLPQGQEVINKAYELDYVQIISRSDPDSLLASGIIMETMHELGREASITLDLKQVIDNTDYTRLLVGFDSAPDVKNLLVLKPSKTHSLSGLATFFAKGKTASYYWFSVLSILMGEYRGLDLGKEGFRDIEKSLLDELVEQELVGREFGFRLWGWNRRRLVDQITHTIIPFLPGLTGDVDRVKQLVSRIPGVRDPLSATSRHVLSETEPERAKVFVQLLHDSLRIDPGSRREILYRLIGNVYLVKLGRLRIDSPSAMGSVLVYSALSPNNPSRLPLLAIDQLLLNHLLVIYEKYIDIVAAESGMVVQQLLSGSSVVETDYISRPEVLVDALSSMGRAPPGPVYIRHSELGEVTCASELLRTGAGWADVVKRCDKRQLCSVGGS